MRKSTLRLGDFTISGVSRSAYETYIKFNEYDCAFDIGKSAEAVVNKNHIFISHIHLDHCAGLVHNLASRKLQRLPPVNIYIPEESVDDVKKIISLWEKLQGIKFSYTMIPLVHNQEYQVNKTVFVRAFSVFHRSQSFGFELFEKRKKLCEEFKELSKDDLIRMKNAGDELFYTLKVNKCTYTSDTTVAVFEKYPEILDSSALISECTFIYDEHAEVASNFEHIHFSDLLPYIKSFRGNHFVLCHFSMRYTRDNIITFFDEIRANNPAFSKVQLFL